MNKINHTNMVLRYFIGEENTEKRFEFLTDFLNRSGIRRVILFSAPFAETSSISSLDYYKNHAELLKPYIKKLQDMGVEVGINVLHTNGHCFYADEDEFGFRRAVTSEGEQSRGAVCFADKSFLEHVKKQYGYYAALKPSVIFTDDDIRMISMGQLICLCPEHIKRISERVGRKLSFEEIREHIYSENFEEHPIRNAFFAQMQEDIQNLYRVIADSIHEISPDTEIGIMTKGYPYVTTDTNLHDFFEAFAERKITKIRPGIDYYREGDYNSIPLQFSQPAILREMIDHPDVEMQPEVENDTYGFYYKSNTITKMQMLWCITNGFRNMQVNVFPMIGMVNYEEITGMFEESINYFNALHELIPEGYRTSGIGIYTHPESLTKMRAKNGVLMKEMNWIKWLNLLGLPVGSNFKASNFILLTGDDIFLASDEEIDCILKKGAMMDVRAAEALLARGYGERIGVREISAIDKIYAGERFTENELNGEFQNAANSDYVYSTILSSETIKSITYSDKAEILSCYINHRKEKVCDGVGAYQNEKGERFIILPYMDDEFMAFTTVNHKRRRQLINGFEWVAKKTLPVVAENEKMCVNINRFADKNIITLFQLSTDDALRINLRYIPKGTLQYIDEKTGEKKPLVYTENDDGITIHQSLHSAYGMVVIDQF